MINYDTYWIKLKIIISSISVCLAVAVPYIDLFISLFGALSLSALGLAFPATIDLCTYWFSLKGVRGFLIISKNCLIIGFAALGLVVGTSTSLEKIIEKFASNSTAWYLPVIFRISYCYYMCALIFSNLLLYISVIIQWSGYGKMLLSTFVLFRITFKTCLIYFIIVDILLETMSPWLGKPFVSS